MKEQEQKLHDRVTAALSKWERVRREADDVRSRYIAIGSLGTGRKITWPERTLDLNGIKEIQEADKREKKACQEWEEAVETYASHHRAEHP